MSNEEPLKPEPDSLPPVAAKEFSPTPPADSGNLPFAVSLVALVAGLIAIALSTIFQPKIEQGPMIYVIDSEKIVEAKLRSLQSKNATPETVRRDAADFMSKLEKFVKTQSDAGRTVVNRNAVIAWPEGADITLEAAKAMGVEMVAAPAAIDTSKAPAVPAPADIGVPKIPLAPAQTEALPEIPLPSSQGGQ